MLNFSIHTFELRLEVKTRDIQNIRDWLYSRGISIKECNGVLNILEYANQGVRIRLIPERYKPHFLFIINLREVMENGNLVDLIEQENVENALRQVNDIISIFFENEYDLDSLKLSRIDFCVNINVGSQKAADTYIKLLNFKNGNYGRFRIKNINSRKGYYKNGFLAETAANDIAVSVYSKKAQLLSIKRESEAVRAEKILRVEVQLKRRSAIARYFPKDMTNAELIKAAVNISQEIIGEIVFKVIQPGDYYKLPDAVKLVKSAVDKKKLRRRMIRLLELTADKHSVARAKEVMLKEDKKLSEKSFRNLLKEFQALNLNVVTLGRRCEFNKLDGLDTLIFEQ